MKLFALAGAVLLAALAPAHAEIRIFPEAARVGTVAGLELSPEQRRYYRQYRKNASYFGAFYIAPGTDFFGDTVNYHSFDTAKAAAQKICELASGGKDCTLYAVTYPAGVDPNAKDLRGLSQPAAKDFTGIYQRSQEPGRYGAFAVNGAFGYGQSFGWSSEAEAKASALNFCTADSYEALAFLPKAGRDWARQRNLAACTIVSVHSPD